MIGITVHGMPAPQGSKRHLGAGRMVESSKKVKPWREAVKFAALAVEGFQAGPVNVEITFTLPKPAGAPKRTRSFPMRKPDIDKLIRSTLDGLVDAGAIEDDARVVQITARKCFPNEDPCALAHPGAVIRIESY